MWRCKQFNYYFLLLLGFIGADIKDDYVFQRWLVFDYHANGSVYDYLQTHVLDIKSMLKMVAGIAEGLHHLHKEILTFTVNKPAIAHRDMKTKNLLVKFDGKIDFDCKWKYMFDPHVSLLLIKIKFKDPLDHTLIHSPLLDRPSWRFARIWIPDSYIFFNENDIFVNL